METSTQTVFLGGSGGGGGGIANARSKANNKARCNVLTNNQGFGCIMRVFLCNCNN